MSRKKNTKNLYNQVLIFTNGITEKIYFELIKEKKITAYTLKINHFTANPEQLVRKAIEYKEQSDGTINQIWCIFDIDNSHNEKVLEPALILANKNRIQIGYSNLSFEVWLLLHYTTIIAQTTNNNKLIKNIDDLYHNNIKCKQNYDKTNKNDLKKYFISHLKDAITNAKVIHQKQIKKYNYKQETADCIAKYNPCSTVYKLIEALNKYK